MSREGFDRQMKHGLQQAKAGKGIDSWWKGIQKSNQKAQKEWQKADKLRDEADNVAL